MEQPAVPRRPSGWVEGERVFGPPGGTYDADWVASAAVAEGVPPDDAHRLAVVAWQLLRAGVGAGALASALGGDEAAGGEAAGVVAAGVVARAAVEFCALYGVEVTAG